MTAVEKANEFFGKDVFATKTTGIVIEDVADKYAKCSLALDSRHMNAADRVMGGAIFTLADFTFAVASNFGRPLTVSVTSQITYTGAAKGKKLISEAKCEKWGRRTCFYTIRIKDDLDNDVAIVSTSGMLA